MKPKVIQKGKKFYILHKTEFIDNVIITNGKSITLSKEGKIICIYCESELRMILTGSPKNDKGRFFCTQCNEHMGNYRTSKDFSIFRRK